MPTIGDGLFPTATAGFDPKLTFGAINLLAGALPDAASVATARR